MPPSFSPVLSCFCIWTTCYYMLCMLNHEKSSEFNCRIVTIIHGVFSCILCSYCGFIVGPWPFDALGEQNTPLQTLCIVVTLGYFMFDFLWCVLKQTEGIDMLLHHITSICGLCLSMYLEHSGSELVATIFGSEISNPCLQMRWFLRDAGKYNTHIAKLNDILFIALFLVIRIGLGSQLLHCTLFSSKSHVLIKLGGASLYTISLVWMIFILMFARKRFFGKKSTWIWHHWLTKISGNLGTIIKRVALMERFILRK